MVDIIGRVYVFRQIKFSRRQHLEFYLPTLPALSVHLINNLVIGFFDFFLGELILCLKVMNKPIPVLNAKLVRRV